MSKIRTARIELYRQKGKIHSRTVSGRFNTLRWIMVWISQLIFYGTCWLNWDNRQAVLFDIAHEKFYLFGLVLWPQDGLLLALLLIVSATALFFVTALAGRLFCGFVCPQTVYTSIFVWIEARVEGDHIARLRLDNAPASLRKLALRTTKHVLWLLVAAWTGITFVGYFTPIDELLGSLASATFGPWEGFWVLFYALFTYVQAGFAREAVCQHMCPYSRFQGVMFDATTSSVAYDVNRGEPRAARRSSSGDAEQGDCIDSGICVQVCPTGIDIRDGLQYQCINCGLCADACDDVMTKTGAPTGLIRFASEQTLAGKSPAPLNRRPRVAIYGALLVLLLGIGGWTLAQRNLLLVDVLRDRGALWRETAEGVENTYTLKLMNLAETPQDIEISAAGIPGLYIVGEAVHALAAGSVRPVHLTLATADGSGLSGIQPIRIEIRSKQQPELHLVEKSTFARP
jgi:cytochrome c oxidase accessory protein FixG